MVEEARPVINNGTLLIASNHPVSGSGGFKAGLAQLIGSSEQELTNNYVTNPSMIRQYHYREIQKSGIIKHNIYEIDFGDYHQYQNEIINSVKRVHAATNRSFTLEREQLAASLSGNVSGKVNMMVRGGLIRPAIVPAVSFVVGQVVNHFQNLHNERIVASKQGSGEITTANENEQFNLSLQNLKSKIDQDIESRMRLPVQIAKADQKILQQIRKEIQRSANHLSSQEQEKIVALSYYAHKAYEKNPDLMPKKQLVLAPAIRGIGLAGLEIASWIETAVAAGRSIYTAYKVGMYISATSIIIGQVDIDKYNSQLGILEKRKQGNSGDSQKVPKLPDLKSPNIDPNDFEPDEEKKRNIDKEARKLNLRKENPTHQKLLDNLDTSVEDFIVKDRKGSIRSEFPGEFLKTPLREVLEKAKAGDRAARTARKLLTEIRFLK